MNRHKPTDPIAHATAADPIPDRIVQALLAQVQPALLDASREDGPAVVTWSFGGVLQTIRQDGAEPRGVIVMTADEYQQALGAVARAVAVETIAEFVRLALAVSPPYAPGTVATAWGHDITDAAPELATAEGDDAFASLQEQVAADVDAGRLSYLDGRLELAGETIAGGSDK